MTRRIGIFYLSLAHPRSAPNWNRRGSPVVTRRKPGRMPEYVFVRCAVAKATTLEAALDEAKPRRGETVMNTHYIDPPE
jgi:hypothetical protein